VEEKYMKTPLDEHMKDYRKDIWKEYTVEELMWWVLNLTRRSTHRKNIAKAKKDLYDAKNYLWMLEHAIEDDINNGTSKVIKK
jgi:hypothetical protein